MARVLKQSHSFTCTPRVHPLTANKARSHMALRPCCNLRTEQPNSTWWPTNHV